MLNRQLFLILAFISSFAAVPASASPTPEPTYGRCYEMFQERRHQLALQSLLIDPFAGIAGDGIGMTAGSAIAGSLAGVGAGLVVAGSVGVVFETRSIILWAETAHTMKLIRESYTHESNAKDGQALANLSARLNLPETEIAQKIMTWTDNGMLCDGSLKAHKPRNHRLKNLLPTPKELRAALVAD